MKRIVTVLFLGSLSTVACPQINGSFKCVNTNYDKKGNVISTDITMERIVTSSDDVGKYMETTYVDGDMTETTLLYTDGKKHILGESEGKVSYEVQCSESHMNVFVEVKQERKIETTSGELRLTKTGHTAESYSSSGEVIRSVCTKE